MLPCLSDIIVCFLQLVVWPFSLLCVSVSPGMGVGEQDYLLRHPWEAVAEHQFSSASPESHQSPLALQSFHLLNGWACNHDPRSLLESDFLLPCSAPM